MQLLTLTVCFQIRVCHGVNVIIIFLVSIVPHNLKVLNVSNADIKNSTSDLFIALRAFKATLLSFLQHFTSFLSYLKEVKLIFITFIFL